jgi:hypothetical protein
MIGDWDAKLMANKNTVHLKKAAIFLAKKARDKKNG